MSLIQQLKFLLAGDTADAEKTESTHHGSRTFIGSATQTMLRLIDRDDFYQNDADPKATTDQRRKSAENLKISPKLQKIVQNLDITRITNRLIVCGLPWRQRTERGSRRNNVDDLATFLNFRYPGRYMIWSLTSNRGNEFQSLHYSLEAL